MQLSWWERLCKKHFFSVEQNPLISLVVFQQPNMGILAAWNWSSSGSATSKIGFPIHIDVSSSDLEYNENINELLEISLQTAEAIAYCHKLNIVHRDIKPAVWCPNVEYTNRISWRYPPLQALRFWYGGFCSFIRQAIYRLPRLNSVPCAWNVKKSRNTLWRFGARHLVR